MTYFKINEVDFSNYINELKINKKSIYNAQTNAAGNTVADYINAKREIEVGIIPLKAEAMANLQAIIEEFNVSVSFYNPKTNTIEENVNCIIPEDGIEFYTIQQDNVMYKAFKIKIIEL